MTDSDELAALLAAPTCDPRPYPLPAPATEWDASPTRCLTVNAEWATHMIGVLDRLLELDAWIGTDEEVFAAFQAIEEIQAQLSKPCEAAHWKLGVVGFSELGSTTILS